MLAEERRGAGEASGEVVAEVTALVRGIHEGIAERVFRLVPGSRPVKAVHDRIAGGVYDVVAGASRRGLTAVGRLAALAPDRPALAATAAGATTQAIANGVVGDLLVERGNPLAITMAVRAGGADIALTPAALARAHPTAGRRIAVHLHGLTEDIGAWSWSSAKFGVAPRPSAFERELGLTPVFVRYNTGRHISQNGVDLDALLRDLVAAWPVESPEVVLIGHSMGALVAEAALIRGDRFGESWVGQVRHLVTLAAPHHGAGLERVVNRGMAMAARSSVTRPLATFLNLRSVGIKDLRHGEIGDAWQDRDPDDVLPDVRPATELPGHVKVHAIGASLSRDPQSWVARRFGDILVTPDSAAGRRASGWVLEPDTVQVVARASHFDILGHPDVTAHLTRVLA